MKLKNNYVFLNPIKQLSKENLETVLMKGLLKYSFIF